MSQEAIEAVVLSAAQMRVAEQQAMTAGAGGNTLMERAGAAVAAIVVASMPASTRVMVACGPGDNGGDGFVVARILAGRGYAVSVGLLGTRDRLPPGAAAAAALWTGEIADIATLSFEDADIIVDALFGIGLNRDIDGPARRVIERINAANRPVVAIDVPSGVEGDTGRVRGVAVRATRTVTFLRLKPAHLLFPGRALSGIVTVADIGIGSDIVAGLVPDLFHNEPALWRHVYPTPRTTGHKYDRGHAVIFAGGLESVGAARLAARAALRIGAGLVTLAVPEVALQAHASRGPDALMVRCMDWSLATSPLLDDPRHTAVVIGPAFGVGPATCAAVARVAWPGRAIVLDADALTSYAGAAAELARLIAAAAAPVVLTPHEGEFRRLFPDLPDAFGKLARARHAARRTGAVVVFKGADTVVAAPDGRAAIADNATADMATAGSGDVLAGIIAGLLAQSMPAFEAAAAAVWLHGEAGRAAGPGLIADDLPEALRAAARTCGALEPGLAAEIGQLGAIASTRLVRGHQPDNHGQ